jgi:plastocyanin
MGRTSRLSTAAVLLVALTGLAAACGNPSSSTTPGPQGLERAPANLDPASPIVRARNIAFDRHELGVPAQRPFVIVFENRESFLHNISIYSDAEMQHAVFEGLTFQGPGTRWYSVGGLAPGRYFFQCIVHPIDAMKGTLTAV